MRDESDLSGLKLAIDLKRGTDPDKLMAKLFKMTPLMDSYGCNFNVLISGMPVDPVEWWDKNWMRENIIHKLAETFNRQIRKAVCADILCYLFRRTALSCYEVLLRVDISTEVTGMHERRR